jgi:hypothetical protein
VIGGAPHVACAGPLAGAIWPTTARAMSTWLVPSAFGKYGEDTA